MLTKIGAKAFKSCGILNRLEFPPLLQIIKEFAFEYSSFFIIDLRNTKVRLIGKHAFISESKVKLPATVTPESIINCSQSRLYVDERHRFAKRDESGCLYIKNAIIDANKVRRRIFIRNSVEKIGKYCFNGGIIVSLTFPSSVTKISKEAFLNCKRLKFICFAKDSRLSKIGKSAFASCVSLTKIKFPGSLKVTKMMPLNLLQIGKSFHSQFSIKEN